MPHTIKDKQKLLNRIRRIRGQVEAVEKALDQEQGCFAVLQTVAACHGAINGLMAVIMEGHIRFHILDPGQRPTKEQTRAAEELIDVVKAYLK